MSHCSGKRPAGDWRGPDAKRLERLDVQWTQQQRSVVIVPPSCDSLKASSNPVKFGRFSLPRLYPSSTLCARTTCGNGARITKRAEPTDEAGPARTHQFRHRPDPGGRNRAGKRPHGRSTERIWRGQWSCGRLLQLGEPHRSQRTVLHRAVHLPVRYHAAGGRFCVVRREQESRQPRRHQGPGTQTDDGTWTSEPGPERGTRVRRAVLPVDWKQVRQGPDIRWVSTDRRDAWLFGIYIWVDCVWNWAQKNTNSTCYGQGLILLFLIKTRFSVLWVLKTSI